MMQSDTDTHKTTEEHASTSLELGGGHVFLDTIGVCVLRTVEPRHVIIEDTFVFNLQNSLPHGKHLSKGKSGPHGVHSGRDLSGCQRRPVSGNKGRSRDYQLLGVQADAVCRLRWVRQL